MENEQNEIRRSTERNSVLSTLGTIDILNLLERKKNDVLDGNEDGYKVMLMIKKIDEYLKKVKSDILDVAVSETSDKIEWNGFCFENTASGRYDYTVNQEWVKLNTQRKQLEKDMQMACKSNNSYINEETGEIIQAAIFKANKTSVKITKLLTKN